MLVKHVCPQCGHHYLADDQDQGIDCPRCHAAAPDSWVPQGGGPGGMGALHQPHLPPDVPQGGYGEEEYDPSQESDPTIHRSDFGFAPLEPPPMLLTSDRVLRGLASGVVGTLLIGLVVGAAFGAIRIAVPLVTGLLIGLAAGYSAKRGFGARSAARTRLRAVCVVFVAVLAGFGGCVTGGWLVERFVAVRADQAREDLKAGLRGLERQRSRIADAGTKILIDERIAQVRALQERSDAGLEDYLWIQQAQLKPAVLAYGKLRATRGPLLQLGPDAEPKRLSRDLSLAMLGGELLAALLLAAWLVTPRRP